MDEQTNYNEVMHKKPAKQESWSLYKTLVNESQKSESWTQTTTWWRRWIHKVLDNQKPKIEILTINKATLRRQKEKIKSCQVPEE